MSFPTLFFFLSSIKKKKEEERHSIPKDSQPPQESKRLLSFRKKNRQKGRKKTAKWSFRMFSGYFVERFRDFVADFPGTWIGKQETRWLHKAWNWCFVMKIKKHKITFKSMSWKNIFCPFKHFVPFPPEKIQRTKNSYSPFFRFKVMQSSWKFDPTLVST